MQFMSSALRCSYQFMQYDNWQLQWHWQTDNKAAWNVSWWPSPRTRGRHILADKSIVRRCWRVCDWWIELARRCPSTEYEEQSTPFRSKTLSEWELRRSKRAPSWTSLALVECRPVAGTTPTRAIRQTMRMAALRSSAAIIIIIITRQFLRRRNAAAVTTSYKGAQLRS